jgi:hypothetical protein
MSPPWKLPSSEPVDLQWIRIEFDLTCRHPDGREALTAEGAWLHHAVLAGGIGGIWAAGNERPTLRLNSQHKYGIDWPDNNFGMQIDLMSEAPKPMNLSLSILFEYLEKTQPEAKDYRSSYMRWNQIGFPQAQDGKYSFKSYPWTSTVSGELLYAIGRSSLDS